MNEKWGQVDKQNRIDENSGTIHVGNFVNVVLLIFKVQWGQQDRIGKLYHTQWLEFVK